MSEHGFIPFDVGVVKDPFGPEFLCKFDGVCPACGHPILVGEHTIHLRKSTQKYEHVECPDSPDDLGPQHSADYTIKGARKPKLCKKCWLEHAGEECP